MALPKALPWEGERTKTPDSKGEDFCHFSISNLLSIGLTFGLAKTVLSVTALCYLALQLQGQCFLLFNLPPPLPSS